MLYVIRTIGKSEYLHALALSIMGSLSEMDGEK